MKRRFLSLFLLVIAAPLALLVLHSLGARSDLGILSGTLPGSEVGALLALAYALAWFGSVLVTPVIAIAAALGFAHGRIAAWMRTWRSYRAP